MCQSSDSPLRQAYHSLDLDGEAERQGCNSNCGPGSSAGLAQHLDEEVGGAIRDEMLFGEVGR